MSEKFQIASSVLNPSDLEAVPPSWLKVYSLPLKREGDRDESDDEEEGRNERWSLGLMFTRRLNTLRREAKHLQYMFAVTSTLGGANHLCNRPERALIMAKKQEEIGLKLNASNIIVRSRVFQAVNYAQMKDLKTANSLFRRAYRHAKQTGDETTINFTRAVHAWLVKDIAINASDSASLEVAEG